MAPITAHTDGVPADPSRRGFLRQLLPQAVDYCARLREECQGRPQMLLSDLDAFPDSALRTVIPVFSREAAYRFDGSLLSVADPQTGEYLLCIAMTPEDSAVFELFDCGLTLDEIAHQVCVSTEEDAFPRVKALFLTLSRCAVCHPAQSLAELDPGVPG
jgi:hypothetical protein